MTPLAACFDANSALAARLRTVLNGTISSVAPSLDPGPSARARRTAGERNPAVSRCRRRRHGNASSPGSADTREVVITHEGTP